MGRATYTQRRQLNRRACARRSARPSAEKVYGGIHRLLAAVGAGLLRRCRVQRRIRLFLGRDHTLFAPLHDLRERPTTTSNTKPLNHHSRRQTLYTPHIHHTYIWAAVIRVKKSRASNAMMKEEGRRSEGTRSTRRPSSRLTAPATWSQVRLRVASYPVTRSLKKRRRIVPAVKVFRRVCC